MSIALQPEAISLLIDKPRQGSSIEPSLIIIYWCFASIADLFSWFNSLLFFSFVKSFVGTANQVNL